MDKQAQIREAINALELATTYVYNIEGDRWQMAHDVLESLLNNLNIEWVKE